MPISMVDAQVVKDAVQLACRAPSLHNSQPWRWIAVDGGLQLFVDRGRVLPSTDRSAREAIISCGAVLDHLRVAMAAVGWTTNVDRLPNPNNRDHLATLDFARMEFVSDGHRRRADAILLRRTDRLPLAAPPDWATFEPLLRSRIDDRVAHLDVIADEDRARLVEASRLTETLRMYDASYHTELNWWTGHFENTDGIPQSSLISAAESERVDLGRPFPVTSHGERRPSIAEDHSKVVVLSTDDDTREDVLRCGETLSNVLLECILAGMATCTLTHITELATSRHLIAWLTGRDAQPQVLIRVGIAPIREQVPPPTPRRPLEDVLSFR